MAWLLIILLSFAASWYLTFRYFPFEPDVANSPLVWQGFLREGFSVFRDWFPTPDNWYFTVYPINFIFFSLLSSDGRFALTLSTMFFVFITPLIVAAIINATHKKFTFLFAPILIISLPAYCYIYGFIAHPFSHYSTNCFGVVVFALCFFNLKKQSIAICALYSVLSLLAAVSDPWFSATYFLPLLLTHFYFTWQNVITRKITIIYLLVFIFTMIHAVPRWLHIPIQRFELVPFEQWVINVEWVIYVMGRSLNLFFVENKIAYIISLAVWFALFIHAIVICWGKGIKARFIVTFSILSIAAIISSFIIGYDMPYENSARFFVNAFVFLMTVVTMRLSFKNSAFVVFLFALFLSSSCYSYYKTDAPFIDQEKQTWAYIDFLKKNNLTFGYGDYWQLSNNVNWLSDSQIHITPVRWDDNYQIMSTEPRVQTMRSWLKTDFIQQSPQRQFVSIPAIETADMNSEANRRLDAIRKQLGAADEVLTFEGMTLMVYNHRIMFP
jgi:hypothetical protein